MFTQIVIVFNKVEALMQQVAEENGLEIMSELEAVQPGTSSLRTQEGERSQKDEDQLSKRWEGPQFLSYLLKHFMHLCRALYGDAILVYCFGAPIRPPEINKNIWSSLFL